MLKKLFYIGSMIGAVWLEFYVGHLILTNIPDFANTWYFIPTIVSGIAIFLCISFYCIKNLDD